MSTGRRETTTKIVWGAVIGAGAYLLGFAVTYVWMAPAVSDAVRGINVVAELLGTASIPTWKGVGWVFYGAHSVATLFPTFGGDTMVNLVGRSDGAEVLYLLPPVLLLVAGAVLARVDGTESIQDGARRGAAVVLGYLPLAVLGVVVTTHAIAVVDRSIAPDLVTAALVAGLVYPVAFGGIGGLIASWR